MPHIEAQLHRACHLIDVLSTGTGGADKALADFGVVEDEPIGDRDHRVCGKRLALHGGGAGSVSEDSTASDRRPAFLPSLAGRRRGACRVIVGANMPRLSYTAP